MGEKAQLGAEPLFPRRMSAWTRRSRFHWSRALIFITCILLFLLHRRHNQHQQHASHSLPAASSAYSYSDAYDSPPSPERLAGFKPFPISGFVNTGKTGTIDCDTLRHEGQLFVEDPVEMTDDIYEIAESLKSHPIVDYNGQDKSLTHEQIVEKTWLRMAQSSVWLENYSVYLTVTRVLFYTKGVRHWPVMSFLRGQIHDENWKEIRGYEMHWQGEIIKFPRVFDIPAPYVLGGGFYGPEDPRVIIEEGHPDAEPVIIFNMVADTEHLNRAMFIMRPFSNDTTLLKIAGRATGQSEKNWAPFFYRSEIERRAPEWPSHWLYFIYNFKPLYVLRCHLLNGWCEIVFNADNEPQHLSSPHNDTFGSVRGGTQLMTLSTENGRQTYVGFPRTNMAAGCAAEHTYRPVMMLFTAASSHHFHIDYLSDEIEFGTAVLSPSARADPCGEGRILLSNSLAKFDRGHADMLTVTFTVDDVTTQFLRLHGVQALVDSIPARSRAQPAPDDTLGSLGPRLFDMQYAIVGQDVIGCALESAKNQSFIRAAGVNGTDLRRVRVEKEKATLEEERKIKEMTRVKLDEARKEADAKAAQEAEKRKQEEAAAEKARKEKEIEEKVQQAFEKAKQEEEARREGYASAKDRDKAKEEEEARRNGYGGAKDKDKDKDKDKEEKAYRNELEGAQDKDNEAGRDGYGGAKDKDKDKDDAGSEY